MVIYVFTRNGRQSPAIREEQEDNSNRPDIMKLIEYSESVLKELKIEANANEIAQCLVSHFGFRFIPSSEVQIIEI